MPLPYASAWIEAGSSESLGICAARTNTGTTGIVAAQRSFDLNPDEVVQVIELLPPLTPGVVSQRLR
jgi:hypothetical protein